MDFGVLMDMLMVLALTVGIVGGLSVVAMLLLHILAQRSQQHMEELGVNSVVAIIRLGVLGIIGANNIEKIDNQLEDSAPKT